MCPVGFSFVDREVSEAVHGKPVHRGVHHKWRVPVCEAQCAAPWWLPAWFRCGGSEAHPSDDTEYEVAQPEVGYKPMKSGKGIRVTSDM